MIDIKIAEPAGYTTAEIMSKDRSNVPGNYIPAGLYRDQYNNKIIRPSYIPFYLKTEYLPVIVVRDEDSDDFPFVIYTSPDAITASYCEKDSIWAYCAPGSTFTFTQESP